MQTPTSKSLGKRHADSFETGDAGGEIDEIAMCEA
jgi:hypothetical protein